MDSKKTTFEAVLIEDEGLMRSLLLEYARAIEGPVRIVDVAATAEEGIELVRTRRPDVALIDLMLPDRSGLEVLEALHEDPGPTTKAVVLSASTDPRHVHAAMQMPGLAGYIDKGPDVAHIFKLIPRICAGERLITARATAGDGSTASKAIVVPSERELELHSWVASGLTVQEAARVMEVAEAKARTWIRRVRDKLGTRSRTDSIVALLELGLIRRRPLPPGIVRHQGDDPTREHPIRTGSD